MIGHLVGKINPVPWTDRGGGQIHGWIEEVTFIEQMKKIKSCSSPKAGLCSTKATSWGCEAESDAGDKKCNFFPFSALITSGPKINQEQLLFGFICLKNFHCFVCFVIRRQKKKLFSSSNICQNIRLFFAN